MNLLDIQELFFGDEEGKEGLRYDMPQESPLLEAIDNCLTVDLIPLDGVVQYAKNLDFGRWGQAIASLEPVTHSLPLSPEIAHNRAPSPTSQQIQGKGGLSAEVQKSIRQLQSALPDATSGLDLYEDSQFFDGTANETDTSTIETHKYRTWRTQYGSVYKKFFSDHLGGPLSNPVKIAILDTGIDRDHALLEAYENNIKGKKNLYNSAQKNVPDSNGHGTFTTALILDYAPDSSLYIIKITDKKNARPDADVVARAIYDAVNEWEVDIISMSFGWPSSDVIGYEALEDAIDHAYSKKVLMFAAASNSGARLGRAYPASNSQVICVHSTDTDGQASKFSPTAEPNTINLATVGEFVESAWPILLSEDSSSIKSRSGTSFAAPIMAGIAGFLLQYARLHLPETLATMLKRRDKMEALLKRCAIRGPNYRPRDDYFYVHLSLHKHNLFGEELEWINHEISRILKT
ncbi:hypothetical protein ACHAPU_003135 [Fusarium lateritium]